MNRVAGVFNSDVDKGSPSHHISKSASLDASVLKERNSNESADAMKASQQNDANSSHKDGKSIKIVDCRSHAQSASNSETNTKKLSNQQSENEAGDVAISLDLDLELNDDENVDDSEKCAKAMTSEGDNDSQNAISMDVDEPTEDLYVMKQTESNNAKQINDKLDKSVTIESEDESQSKEDDKVDGHQKIVVNGVDKSEQSSDTDPNENNDTDLEKGKLSGDSASSKNVTKTKKRKISISSDDEQPPPAKR